MHSCISATLPDGIYLRRHDSHTRNVLSSGSSHGRCETRSSLPSRDTGPANCYRRGDLQLTCFTDGDFAADIVTRRSCTGFLFVLGGGVISSASVLQKTVAQSAAEAESMALHVAPREGVYLFNPVKELGVDIDKFAMFSDSQSALSLSSQAMFSPRTKHILPLNIIYFDSWLTLRPSSSVTFRLACN